MHTKTKGNIGELRVAADLYEKGFSVFREYGDNSKIDIIAAKGSKLYKIQVKSLHPKNGGITIPKVSSGPGYSYEYTRDDIDIIASFNLENNTIAYVPFSVLESYKRGITLRVEASKNNQEKGIRQFFEFLEFPEIL